MSDIPLHHWLNRRRGFVERTLADLSLILDRAYAGETLAKDHPLQRLDPRVKLLSAIVLILHSASTQSLWTLTTVVSAAILLALANRLPAGPIFRLWFTVGLFAAVLAVPALFLTPGKPYFSLPFLRWNLTETGAIVAARLILRALASSTIAAVLVLSTPWQHLLKALRRFGVPVVGVVLIGMSYRYIVLFLQTAVDLTNARKSRTVGWLSFAERRRIAISSLGVMLERAFHLGEEVHLAMRARGYRGEISLLDDFVIAQRDWLALSGLLLFELLLLRVIP